MKRLIAIFLTAITASACGAGAPPKDSASRAAYDSCNATADLIEKAGGSKARSAAQQYREYCTCTSKFYWSLEKEKGYSFIFEAIDNQEFDEEVFEKCATAEMRKKREEEIELAKKRKEEIIEFINSIDALYK